MASGLEAAFNFLCSMKSFPGTLTRNGSTPVTISVGLTPSNYSRKIDAPEQTVTYGREYLIPYKFFEGTALKEPRRGDTISGTVLRSEAIGEVETLFNMGGTIFGWRVRTE